MDTQKIYTIPHKMELKEPIRTFNTEGDEIESARVEKLVFSNPLNAGMIASIPAGENADLSIGSFYPIISKMTGQTMANINKLGVTDVMEAIEVVSYFLEPGPTTGGTL
mgnify:CR=1 FL=1